MAPNPSDLVSVAAPPGARPGRPARVLAGVVRGYQLCLAPFWQCFGIRGGCRFEPTCSEYMRQAVLVHGLARGVGLGLARLGRCHPWGSCGHDPVPAPDHSATAPATRALKRLV